MSKSTEELQRQMKYLDRKADIVLEGPNSNPMGSTEEKACLMRYIKNIHNLYPEKGNINFAVIAGIIDEAMSEEISDEILEMHQACGEAILAQHVGIKYKKKDKNAIPVIPGQTSIFGGGNL